MKKTCLVLFSILLFVVGVNLVKAADSIYKFDATMDKKVIWNNWYDFISIRILEDYFDTTSGYSIESYYDENDDEFHRLKKGDVWYFLYDLNHGSIDINPDLTADDNFAIDLTREDFIALLDNNRLEIYFESDEQIPVIDEYTLDLTKDTWEDLIADITDRKMIVLCLLIYFFDQDDVTPDLPYTGFTGEPILLKKNGVEFFEYGVDADTGDQYIKLLNEDKFTTDDNLSYTDEELLAYASNRTDPEVAELANYADTFGTLFRKVNIIISNNPPIEEEEEETPTVTPDKKEESKNKDKNPKTVDNVLGYLSFIGVSVIACGFIHIKAKQHS